MSGWAGAQNLHGEQGKAVLYTGMMDCFKKTFKEEGMSAFFKVTQLLFKRSCVLLMACALC